MDWSSILILKTVVTRLIRIVCELSHVMSLLSRSLCRSSNKKPFGHPYGTIEHPDRNSQVPESRSRSFNGSLRESILWCCHQDWLSETGKELFSKVEFRGRSRNETDTGRRLISLFESETGGRKGPSREGKKGILVSTRRHGGLSFVSHTQTYRTMETYEICHWIGLG